MKIAVDARESEIVDIIGTTVLLGGDVLEMCSICRAASGESS
jgi:hypothetical protein